MKSLTRISPLRTTLATISAWLMYTVCAVPLCAQIGPGTALNFNGVDQRVQIPRFFTNAPSTEVTVEFWQDVSSVQSQSTFSQDDAERGGFDASNVFNAHVPYGDGTVYWDFGDIDGEGRLSYTPPESLVGTWQHFAFEASQSGNFMRIYRNGILEAEKVGMTAFRGGDFDLDIGGESFVPYGGLIDEFRIWKVTRSQAEIQAYMYRTLPLLQTNLVAYWRFDEGVGDSVQDSSGHGRAGRLVNGPLWVDSTAPFHPFLAVTASSGALSLTWKSVAGRSYQLESATDLTQPIWSNSGSPLTASNTTVTATQTIGPDRQRFYRVVLLP